MSKQYVLESVFIGCVVGTIYKMAPNNKPRKVEEIVDGIKKYFKKHCTEIIDTYVLEEDTTKMRDTVEKIMMSIPAFIELNLSQHEFELGVSVEDDDRQKYTFVTWDSVIDSRHDFIDLDACIRQIDEALYWKWVDNEMFEKRAELIIKQ